MFSNLVERKAEDEGLQFEIAFDVAFQRYVNSSLCGSSPIQMIKWVQSFHDDDDANIKINNSGARDCIGFWYITAYYLWDLF